MTDSRVEKIFRLGFLRDWAERSVKAFEAAGLVVIDPDDEATILRLAKAYHASTEANDEAVIEGDIETITWEDDLEVIRQSYIRDVRIILAALKGGK